MNATSIPHTGTYDSDITAATKGKVVQRRNPVWMGLSGVFFLVGIVLLIITLTMTQRGATLFSLLMALGIVAILAGLSLILFTGKQWVYLPTKSRIRINSYYIDPAYYYAVCQAIEMRDISRLPKLKILSDSNVRLDMYISDDRQFAAAQTFHYAPYSYNAVTPICCAYGEHAKELSLLF